MYDLERDHQSVPADIEDTMMQAKMGSIAYLVLFMPNAGIEDESDWKRFIRELEQKNKGADHA